jgi:hypothetical protein
MLPVNINYSHTTFPFCVTLFTNSTFTIKDPFWLKDKLFIGQGLHSS